MNKKIVVIVPLLFVVALSFLAFPVSANLYLLSYDDGEADEPVSSAGDWLLMVKFAPSFHPCKVMTASIFIAETDGNAFRIHVTDTDLNDLFAPIDVVPTTGWFSVDLSSHDITITGGDFFIALESLTDYDPVFGGDRDTVGQTYSYHPTIQTTPLYINIHNLMIRAEVAPTNREVAIDIKPGSYPNSVNLEEFGILTVAIFGSADVDATDIDPATVELGEVSLATQMKTQNLWYSIEDVNLDGISDFVAKFKVEDLRAAGALTESTTELELNADLYDTTSLFGVDSVIIVPKQ